MSTSYTIGIDLGGTNIKAGLIDSDFRIIQKTSVETQAVEGPDHVLPRICEVARGLLAASKIPTAAVAAVGVGAPGPISHCEGMIYAAPNLPGWQRVSIRDRLQAMLSLPVVLENDANAAAFGEFTAGAGRGVRSMVLLTLGTGIGGGIVIDGHLWRGDFDNAGEVGHTIVEVDGRPCPCGQRGCLERYSSATSIAERVIEAIDAGASSTLAAKVKRGPAQSTTGASELPIDSQDVAAAAAQGDALCARIWDEACCFLSVACVGLMHVINPGRIVLGGGLINAGAQLLMLVRKHYDERRWRIAPGAPTIEFATLGNDAGIVGAAALAREHCAP